MALGRLASSISNTPQSARSLPSGPALLRAAAVAPKMRLAPARLATTLWPAPSSSQLTSRAVVVLPLVPVMTIEPCVRSWVRRVRILGSMTRATSPGSVVPPPRLVMRLSVPVALPASTAAVFLITPSLPNRDRAGDGGPRVDVPDRFRGLLRGFRSLEERGAAAGHPPAFAEALREFFQARLHVLGRFSQVVWSFAFHFVPGTVHIAGGELDAGPRYGEPHGFVCELGQLLAATLGARPAALQEEGDVGAELFGDWPEVDLQREHRFQGPRGRGCVGACAPHTGARWNALVEVDACGQLALHLLFQRLVSFKHGVVVVAYLEARGRELGFVRSVDFEKVVQVDRLERRTQLVESVCGAAHDLEVEIQLGARGQRDRQRDWIALSSARYLVARS